MWTTTKQEIIPIEMVILLCIITFMLPVLLSLQFTEESLYLTFLLTIFTFLARVLVLNMDNLRTVYDSLVFLIIGTICWFCITVLFGAPLIELVLKTLMLNVLQSLLTFFPISHFYKTRQEKISCLERILMKRDFPQTNEQEQILFSSIYGTCFGAWLGALPIPLDWDRPWQAWPFTVYYGSIIGWCLGRVGYKIVGKLYQRTRKNEGDD